MPKTVNYKFSRKLVAKISFDILGIHMEIMEHGLCYQGVWNDSRTILTHSSRMCGSLGCNKCNNKKINKSSKIVIFQLDLHLDADES